MNLEVIKYERICIDGLNRGDVSPADETFTSNCIIHMAGAPNPNLSVEAFKELVTDLWGRPCNTMDGDTREVHEITNIS